MCHLLLHQQDHLDYQEELSTIFINWQISY
jgi:hypothetical protein